MKNDNRKRLLTLGAFGIVFSVVGCDALTNTSGTGQGSGSLKVLITDKPFPVDLLEYANVTITKVEVRRAGSDVCEEECDDGVYCNGEEACVDGECRDGLEPCEEGEVCDEDNDACVAPCSESADCDDGVYCNGTKSCDANSGLCQSGEMPCEEGLWCDEDNATCSADCTSDGQCDDGDACNGAETCNLESGDCDSGDEVTCEEDFFCDSDSGECVADEEEDDDSDGDDGGSPFVVVFEGEKTFNLLDLRNGQTDLLGEAENLDAGSYNLMRVYVTQGEVKLLEDERVFTLDVPSGEQTGIKLHFDFDIEDGGETTLLLDVDLTRAFSAIPSGHIDDPSTIREFKFSPSLAMRLINVLEAGSISGTVTTDVEGEPTAVAGALVTAYDDEGEEVTSTTTDENGVYMLLGLLPSSYDLIFSANGYEEADLAGVAVSAGEDTANQDASLLETP